MARKVATSIREVPFQGLISLPDIALVGGRVVAQSAAAHVDCFFDRTSRGSKSFESEFGEVLAAVVESHN